MVKTSPGIFMKKNPWLCSHLCTYILYYIYAICPKARGVTGGMPSSSSSSLPRMVKAMHCKELTTLPLLPPPLTHDDDFFSFFILPLPFYLTPSILISVHALFSLFFFSFPLLTLSRSISFLDYV